MSTPPKIDPVEAAIREKMSVGLSRKQAEAVLAAQAANDEALAKAERPKAKKD